MSALVWLDPYDDAQPFPNPACALSKPDGLLAVGGSLSPQRLLRAYRNGIFPWYSANEPILWWSPNPRMVLFPECIKISRSLRKTLKKGLFRVTLDNAFATVMQRCSEPRPDQSGTWITPQMCAAYGKLHQLGYAHSVETWHEGELVGGLYGVAIGRVFYGESMFSRMNDASKVALARLTAQLQRWKFAVIDCQARTGHLASLGAEEISRRDFLKLLEQSCSLSSPQGIWHFDTQLDDATI